MAMKKAKKRTVTIIGGHCTAWVNVKHRKIESFARYKDEAERQRCDGETLLPAILTLTAELPAKPKARKR